jgi:hypothetical protein
MLAIFLLYYTLNKTIKKMEEMSIEDCQAIYFDSDALRLPPYQLYRLNNHQGGRFYYKLNEENEPVFFMSVTNMISATMPTSPQLIEWMVGMGSKEAADKYANERAVYGTFMHMKFTELLINRQLGIETMIEDLKACMEAEKIPLSNLDKWSKDIKKDILGFAQFLIEHKVKPLAIEVVLANEEDGYAGAVDLVCSMGMIENGYFGEVYKTTCKGGEKGDPKISKGWVEFKAIVDYKSGRKGFWEEHEIQLQSYEEMVNQNLGITVDRLFNYAPTDWRSTPAFKLKDQTESRSRNKLPHLVKLAKIEAEKRTMEVLDITGTINLDEITKENGVEQYMETISLSTKIQKLHDERKN